MTFALKKNNRYTFIALCIDTAVWLSQQLYQENGTCSYIKKQPERRIKMIKPKTKLMQFHWKRLIPNPAKYSTPDHVYQLTPDHSMLSLSKPKRKRKKRDSTAVWFSDVWSVSSRKKSKNKKKKKQVCLDCSYLKTGNE